MASRSSDWLRRVLNENYRKATARYNCGPAQDRRRFILRSVTGFALAALSTSVAEVSALVETRTERLRRFFKGWVIGDDDTDYEKHRRNIPWQPYRIKIHSRYPGIIIQVASEAEVVAAVKFARENGLRVAVKSGGHNEYGLFLRDGSLLIDLSRLQKIRVDKTLSVAEVQPGVWARNLAEVLRQNDFAFPQPHQATVTLGGFLLGGGHGLNPDAWGTFSCFNILAVDVVMANGELVHCDANQNSDIYWAARGAGPGFFGVVTRFYLKVYKYPQAIKASRYGFPLERLTEAVSWGSQIARSGITNTELILVLMRNPASDHSGDDFICVLNAFIFAQSEAEAERLQKYIEPDEIVESCLFKSEGLPISSFDAIYSPSFDHCFGRSSSDSLWTNVPHKATGILAEGIRAAPSDKNSIIIVFRTDPVLPEDAAASVIGDALIDVFSNWGQAESGEENIYWARNIVQSLEPISVGHYINEVDFFLTPELIEKSFSPSAWKRLKSLKKTHDPDNLFHGFVAPDQ